MKVFLVTFSFITLSVELRVIVAPSAKQNLGYAWFFEPHNLGKLMLEVIFSKY